MKILSLLLLLVSFNVQAFEGYNFSLIFGTANLTKGSADPTYGSGLAVRSEWFVAEDWGMLVSAGSLTTESDSMIGTSSEFEYNMNYGQLGSFLYFAGYFRVGAGLGFAAIDETQRTVSEKLTTSYSKAGTFYQVGFKLPFSSMVFGMDYIHQSFDDFSQKGLFFMLGFVF